MNTIRNIYSIPDLRKRIGFTLAVLAAFRLGAHLLEPQFFLARHTPGLAGRQSVELQGADRDPQNPHHLVAQLRQHAPDLAVLPLVEDHLEDRALFVLRLEVDVLGPGHPLGEADAARRRPKRASADTVSEAGVTLALVVVVVFASV